MFRFQAVSVKAATDKAICFQVFFRGRVRGGKWRRPEFSPDQWWPKALIKFESNHPVGCISADFVAKTEANIKYAHKSIDFDLIEILGQWERD